MKPPAGKPAADLLIIGASEVLTCAVEPCAEESCTADASGAAGRLAGAVVAVSGETILAVGSETEVAVQVDLTGATRLDAAGGVVAPGFVDCHTHLVFGGSRVEEYAARLTHSPEELRTLGIPGGIMSSVSMTRAASRDELAGSAAARLDRMLAHGTTTAESKTGYGLSLPEEMKLLEVNRRLHAEHAVDVVSTFLAAHAFPPEMSAERYVDLVVEQMIPAAAESGLADFNDVFVDEGYYTVNQARRVLEAGLAAGLPAKIHTDQYCSLGGGDLAAELGAVSADHLNMAGPETLARLAEAGCVGVVTPLLDFAVRHPRPADPRAVLGAGLTLALATDLCPGCYAVSMPLAIQFACRNGGLSIGEALWAATAGAARALALEDRGRLETGLLADIQIWDIPRLEDLAYRVGHNPVRKVVKRGKVVV